MARAVMLHAVRYRKGAFVRVLRWAGRVWTGVLVVVVVAAGLLLGLRLLLPLFDEAPSLAASTPSGGAAGVSPRARLTIRFDRPMNPRSVERAIGVVPATDWLAAWSDDDTTLTISPTQSLRPDTDYLLSIGVEALSRRFRPLAEPARLRFRTAPAPAVLAVLPADAATDVPLDSPISIRFSRTIVPAGALMRPRELPELRFDPPAPGTVTWLDQATALFRPAVPLRPGTRYRATLAERLTDTSGGQLGGAFTWSFSTPAPKLLAMSPADGEQLVAPSATLTLTFSQELALDSARASLIISPTVAGDMAARTLPDGRQTIVYAPFSGWQPATTYSVTLTAGAMPTQGNLPLLETTRLNFTTAPRPTLIARFPGEGQTLPNGQAISLVFNATIDAAAFRDAVRFDPPADDIRVSTTDSEVRVAADLRAASAYTMTVPATLADLNGVALDRDYRIRFQTAPASSALTLPDAPEHLAQIAQGQPTSLLVRRTNLSNLNLDLYQLDEASTVRMLGFGEADWSGFQPERYGRPLLRSWQIPLNDPLNTPAEDRVTLATEAGGPLPTGAYYVRLRTLEGPRADLLLLVARTRLTLQASGDAALIWATDIVTGTPGAGLPIALYQGGALIQQGVTGADGIFRFARQSAARLSSYVAIAGGSAPGAAYGAVSGAWGAGDSGAHGDRVFVTTDRASYRPSEQVRLAGFARPAAANTARATPGELFVVARPIADGRRVYQRSLTLGPTGVFSDSFQLDAAAAPGEYTIAATLDGESFQAGFAVAENTRTPLDIAIRPSSPSPAAGQPAIVRIEARSPEGLPVASAAISWTLEAMPAPPPPADGYTFGDDEQAPAPIAKRGGAGQTDAVGAYTLAITDTATALPLRYRLLVQAAETGGAAAQAETSFTLASTESYAGARVPDQIFVVGRPQPVELLALTPAGQPQPETRLRVEVYRRTWERGQETDEGGATRSIWRPRDRLALTQNAVTGADGRVALGLNLPAGGAYRLRASVVGSAAPAAAKTLWATAPGFTAWGELPGGGPLLIADRPAYQPGETARLLLAMPSARESALLTYAEPRSLQARAQIIRAGEPITLTLGADVTSDVPVAVLLAPRAAASGAAMAPQGPPLATTTLPVASERNRLIVAIGADRQAYQAGETATLTITTTDATGAGVPADVILSITGASAAQAPAVGAFRPHAPPLAVAPISSDAAPANASLADPALLDSPIPAPAPSLYWSPLLRTSSSGALTLTVAMPDDPTDLRALAWAASEGRFGEARASLVVSRPLALDIEMSPRLRAGDQVEIVARIANSDSISREVTLALQAAGLSLPTGISALQRVALAPGEQARVSWLARVLDAPAMILSVDARLAGISPLIRQIRMPIEAASGPREPYDAGVALLREFLDPLTGQPLDLATLRIGQLARVRLTAVVGAQIPSLALQDALPANAALLMPGDGDFERVGVAPGGLSLERGASGPGIYQHSYLIRIVAAGRYAAPPTSARGPAGEIGVGNAATLEVQTP